MIVRDLSGDACHEYDLSRLLVFLVATSVDPKAMATSDLGEGEDDQILNHRGSAQKRTSLNFLVRWSDARRSGSRPKN